MSTAQSLGKRFAVSAVLCLAALAFAPRPAAATGVCDPQFVYLGPNQTEPVLTGCCNEDHTWKTGGADQRVCLNPSNMCQKGHCDETTHTCDGGGANKDNYTNAPGSCVFTTDVCVVGECRNQQCQADTDGITTPRCDDGNDCTSDTCGGTSTYNQAACTSSNLSGTDCAYDDSDPCTKGQCTNGACNTTVPDVGAFCGTANGNSCYPATCDSNGVCQPAGSPITCMGDVPVCKKWACSWSGSTSSCTKVKKDYTSYPENNCDDNAHDCNVKRCSKGGQCVGKSPNNLAPTDPDYDPSLNTFICDTNYAVPLTDCIAGNCDTRKNCVEAAPVPNPYPGQTCLTDTDVCTAQTCQGTTCTVTGCTGNACTSCGSAGTCGGTAPGCACTQ